MNEQAIRRLRLRFFTVSFFALFMTMVIIGGMIYTAESFLSERNIKNRLRYIVENDGDLYGEDPVLPENRTGFSPEEERSDYTVIRFLNEIFGEEESFFLVNAESYYTTRYFAVLYNENQEIEEILTNHIATVSAEEAEVYGSLALSRKSSFGRYGVYYYQVADRKAGGRIVVYLDSTDTVEARGRLMYLVLLFIGFGMMVTIILVHIFSYKAIAPEVDNARNQKQFITNASHELKTPLAVIRANTEMQEMLEGETEWTRSTLRQVERLSGLIQNLVLIVRADENSETEEVRDCDVTQVVRESIKSVSSMVTQEGKQLEERIADQVHLMAKDGQLRQLCLLLLDNAIKYCDPEGTIFVSLQQKGKSILLTVSNHYAEGRNVDYSRFFERFYRQQESHTAEEGRGGYGIGLSIAESIAEQYRGSIGARWKEGIISFQCILRPMQGRLLREESGEEGEQGKR